MSLIIFSKGVGFMHNHEHHGHSHEHDIKGVSGARLLYVVFLNLLITVSEFIGGLISGSLALLSDSLHNLSDVSSIIISYVAHKVSQRSANERNTFGYNRARIMAAFINSTMLLIIVAFLFKEAVERLVSPQSIDVKIVILIGTIGLVANLLSMFFLREHSKGDMNVKSAYLHMLSDSLSSVAVILGAVVIYYFRINWLDAILTMAIALYIAKESLEIFLRSVDILMQSAPKNVDIDELVSRVKELSNVENIHHVHLWNLDDKTIFLEAHVNLKEDISVSKSMVIQKDIEKVLSEFGINHVTLQFEYNGCPNCNVISHGINQN